MSQEEGGFTLHFGDQDDWENLSLDNLNNLNLDPSPSVDTNVENVNVEQPSVPDSLDGDIPGQTQTRFVAPSTPNVASVDEAAHVIDPMLIEALETPGKRMMLLKYEDNILNFVRDNTKQTFTFPQMSSYQRLLIHRLSDRFNLDREAVDPGYGGFNGGNSNGEYEQPIRSITLIRTPQTFIPALLINQNPDQSTSLAEQAVPQPQVLNVKKMLKRNPKGSNSGSDNIKTSRGPQQVIKKDSSKMSMTEKEARYAAAKARIFGDEAEEDELTCRTPSPAQPSNMAKGPESSGSIGFTGKGMGRGQRASSDPNVEIRSPGPQPGRSTSDPATNLDNDQQFEKVRESPPPRPNSRGNKGGKGGPKRLSQNRNVDMQDPDFVRLDRGGQGKGMVPQSQVYPGYGMQPPGYYDPRMGVPPMNTSNYYDQASLRPSQIPPPGMYNNMPPRPPPPPATVSQQPYGYTPQGQPIYGGGLPSCQFIYPPDYNTQGMYPQPPMTHDASQQSFGGQQYQSQNYHQAPHQPRPNQRQPTQPRQANGSPQLRTSSLEEFPALS